MERARWDSIDKIYTACNRSDISYLSHHIIDRFPQILKLVIISSSLWILVANKTVFYFIILILLFVKNCL